MGPLVLHQSSRFLGSPGSRVEAPSVPGTRLSLLGCHLGGLLRQQAAQHPFCPRSLSAFQPGRREVTLDPVCAQCSGVSHLTLHLKTLQPLPHPATAQ